MQLARKLADTVARVHDPIMRGAVASKVSARLGVPPRDFEALLARPVRDRVSPAAEISSRQPAVAPRHDIALLCLLALRDAGAREFLLHENWQEVLAQTPDAEMLRRILDADLNLEDTASVNVFMAGLPPEEEALVSSWLLQKMPPNGAAVAKDWWRGLEQTAVRRQLQIAEGRMKIPQLSAGELTNLQKEVVDLKKQLGELSALSSPRVLEK
jgi:DNA primase